MLNPCDAAFLAELSRSLPEGTLAPPEPRHLEEPRGRWKGTAGAVALPRSTADVATLVRACSVARVGLVPWGGGTGLVGGQVLPEGPVPLLVSLERMTAMRGLWPDENALAVEAGMTLAGVQAVAEGAGREFPLSLASEGTATIGGNLATNAGGTGVLRHGNARDLCLGVEAVLADGSVLHGLKRLRKDNAGYDLRHLLIGSEGTLGVITAATLRLVPPPSARVVALLAVPSAAAALQLLRQASEDLDGLILAFELIAGTGVAFLAETGLGPAMPLSPVPDWSVLVELGLPRGMDPEATMAGLYARAEAAGLVTDGAIAMTGAQGRALWALREAIPEANRRIGAISSHDIALPLGVVPAFLAEADARVAAIGPFRINAFGHLGDGNLHYNVFPPKGETRADHEAVRDKVKTAVHDLVHAMGGSVAAEHGLGRLKTGDLLRYADPAKLQMMRALKAALDPVGILNPGAVLPG